MKLRIFFAIAACKLMRFALHAVRHGGTALPGKVAGRICPDLLRHLAKDVECIAITGTNGKTTSARMLEQFFIDSGASYFSNKSGSNLIQGITAEFAYNSTVTGKPKRRHAIIECDEGASKKVFEYLNPSVVLVTNIFKDQLDRFGDVKTVRESIIAGVKNSPNAVLCLNADDSLTSGVADSLPNKIVYFGVDTGIYNTLTDELSDAPDCIYCNTAYEYDHVTYGHLGSFRCPSCGYARKTPDVTVTKITVRSEDSQTVLMRIFGETAEITINLPGGYNIYNAAGAVTAAMKMGFSIEAARDAMQHFECGFGRMEKFSLDGLPVRIILVKNPVGCNQVLNYLLNLSGDALFSICLNDRIADGTDISWISDVRFERLVDMGARLRGVFVSGTRANDMMLRLLDAGFPETMIQVYSDLGDLLDALLKQDAPVYIMPTYTAMLDLRSIISRRFGVKEYWE